MSDVKITDSPEFKQAVAAAVKEALAGLQAVAPMPDTGGDWAEKLAHAIAGVSHQGGMKRERVAPEVQAARDAAYGRMVQTLADLAAAGEVPAYRLVKETYLLEELISPIYRDPQTKRVEATEIAWDGIPNAAMRPANEAAELVWADFTVWADVKGANPSSVNLSVTQNGRVTRQASGLGTVHLDGAPEMGAHAIIRGRGNAGKPRRILGSVSSPALVN